MPLSKAVIDRINEMFRNAEHFPPLRSRSNGPARKSQHSQDSQVVHAPFYLDRPEIEAFEERAAIIEFDGQLSRRDAELKALICVLRQRCSSPVPTKEHATYGTKARHG